MKTKSILCFLCLCISILCYGQKGKLFTVDRELSSSMINSIYQDKEGIIWIATEDGLNRYDGAKFTVYKNIPGTKLKVSFIGYTDKKVVAKNDMKIILVEDVTALEEVEIVAYGTQKKVTMTGAIASVKGEELTRVSVGSVSNVLGGQMTGLTTVQYSGEPGADAAEIFIRGKATWGNSSPLIQVASMSICAGRLHLVFTSSYIFRGAFCE